MADWIGYRWLSEQYGVEPVQPFRVSSNIGKARASSINDGVEVKTYIESSRPEPTFSAHLTFALKQEGVHLEFLARLFDKLPVEVMNEWTSREPSGQYARRAGFFYEWLTGKEIDFPGVVVGNYVQALPEEQYLTATKPINVARWRVRNNLPGTALYCPLVRRTSRIQELEAYDCKARLSELEAEFGTDILLRSAVWLTIRESRASFEIEHEEAKTNRIERFAQVMEKRCGTGDNPLDTEFLTQIQAEILGRNALRTGLRKSPVFIGESHWSGEVVHYVAPHFEQTESMLRGLHVFATSTQGRSSILRAAVLSFGFVYIHPMADGNGRISRFLVNDTLRRDQVAPEPYILPISSTITRSVSNRAAYDQILEQFSKPLMAHFSSACSFGARVTCEDGISTNFHFAAYEEAQMAWSFPDLTAQTEYLGGVIEETVKTEMRREANFLMELSRTRERVKEVIEAPNVELDRIIRSIQQNSGTISGKLVNEFPLLGDKTISRDIINAVLGEAQSTASEGNNLSDSE